MCTPSSRNWCAGTCSSPPWRAAALTTPTIRCSSTSCAASSALRAAPRAAALLGEACRLAGDHTAAVGHFEAALATCVEAAGKITGNARAAALQGLAYSLVKVGEVARAEETAVKAMAELEDGDAALRARVLNTLAIVRYRQDRAAVAIALWQEALARARQAGDDHLLLMIAHHLGLPHAVAGDFRRASERSEEHTSELQSQSNLVCRLLLE